METKRYCAYNLSRESSLSSKLTVADSANQPLKVLKVMIGGLALDAESGLWLKPLAAVPEVPRLFPFDLVYLDGENRVIRGVEVVPGVEFPPLSKQVTSALVLPQQTLSSTQTRTGDHLVICSEDEMTRLLERISEPAVPAPMAPDPGAQAEQQKDAALHARNGNLPSLAPRVTTPIEPATQVERTHNLDISDLFPVAPAAQSVDRVVKDFHEQPSVLAKTPAPTPTPDPIPVFQGAQSAPLVVPRVDSVVVDSLNARPVPAAPTPFTENRTPTVESLPSMPDPVPSASSSPVTPVAKPPDEEIRNQSAPVPAAPGPVIQSTKPPAAKSISPRAPVPNAPSIVMKSMGSTVSNYPSWQVSTSTIPGPPVPSAKPASEEAKSSRVHKSDTPDSQSLQTREAAQPGTVSSKPEPRRSVVPPAITPPATNSAQRVSDNDDLKNRVNEFPRRRRSVTAAPARVAQSPNEQSKEQLPSHTAASAPVVQPEAAPAVGPSLDTSLGFAPSAPAKSVQAPAPAVKTQENRVEAPQREETLAHPALTKRSDGPPSAIPQPAAQQFARTLKVEPQAKPKPQAEPEPHAKTKDSLTSRFMRWLDPEVAPHDRRKADRRNMPGLVAYYFSGGAPKGHEIADISPNGFYMITKDRWMPETMIQMTLQKPSINGRPRRESLTVLSKVVRIGKDGVGAKFVHGEDLDPYSREILPTQATDKKALAKFL